ncbi:hypothetical protein BDW75DRAFT_231983 [Aspergillus navahoensis]
MAPAPVDPSTIDVAEPQKDTLGLPAAARERFEEGRVDLTNGYPYRPARPLYLGNVYQTRDYDCEQIDPGTGADSEKKALLSAAKEVIHLTKHIGEDGLGLLIAERSVVFFRDQDISLQEQKKLGEWYGEIEVHPQVSQVLGIPGATVVWPALQATEIPANFRRPGGASRRHTDLVHERRPAGVTHLHSYTIPSVRGDTLWASGYAAHFRSAHPYLDRNNREAGPKCLSMSTRLCASIRFKWSPRSSALITIHNASWDYEHGTQAKSRREALGLLGKDEIEKLERLNRSPKLVESSY